ncbi:hypothetical protein HD554DRAFT_2149937 [Boletus coccyginus]|nr:hypothetical protein HD554DRAFT_2149937 [Boletus coccyginus]
MSARAAIRRSDPKASQVLDVTLTRDRAVNINKPASLVDTLRKRFRFSPRFGRNRSAVSVPSSEDDFVWDEPNPFGQPDPDQEWLRAIIQADIARTRRFESIGPLDDMPSDEDDYSEDDEDEGEDDGYDEDEDEDHGYDEDYDGDDDDDDDDQSESEINSQDNPSPIVLPRLLPIPLREPLPWADLTQAYDNIAEAEERAFRKAKRDAHRSRSKALAILGPEASSAL